MSAITNGIGQAKWDLFLAIADALIPVTSPDNIAALVAPNFPVGQLPAYCEACPSKTPGFQAAATYVIDLSPDAAARTFALVLTVLSNPMLAPALTGSLTLVKDMTVAQRVLLLQGWRDLALGPKRRLYGFFRMMVVSVWTKCLELNRAAIDHDMRHPAAADGAIPSEAYRFEQCNLSLLPAVDVVICGSGSGAGVVASRLARAGYSVLVVEKGQYFHQLELRVTEKEAFENLYETGGACVTVDQAVLVLAGATLGGGSTVNWSASLKTPDNIRHEWATEFNLPWFESTDFDECCRYVSDFMGVSTEHIEHSFSNQILFDGALNLDLAVKEIPQNTGNRPHACGMCHMGCPDGIKQGGVACWLKDAALNGAHVAWGVMVERIDHKRGRASGVKLRAASGAVHTVKARVVVAAGGALHTPLLLKRSAFSNKNIGKHLRLHPVTVMFGRFPESQRPSEKSIMTTVVTEVDNLDGKGHGAKIETLLHSPILENIFLPWVNGDQNRQNMLQYRNLAALLLITRDMESGSVVEDKKIPGRVVVDYSVTKYDRHALLQALLVASDILYVEGAEELIHPMPKVPRFISAKKDRLVKDVEYQRWRKTVQNTPLVPYQCMFGSAHQMGTCRMSGNGAHQGAVDLSGRLFECANVFVADSSVFPTASGVNPMLSVMTIAHHVAAKVEEALLKETSTAKL